MIAENKNPEKSKQPNLALKKSKRNCIISWLLILAALMFLAYTLWPEIDQISNSFEQFEWSAIFFTVLVSIPMYFLKGLYHVALLGQLKGDSWEGRTALAIYMQSQLVRYLPGKIWGLVYQSRKMTDSHGAGEVIAANLWQTFTTNSLALGLIVSTMLAVSVSSVWLLLLVVTVIIVEAIHRAPYLANLFLRVFRRMTPASLDSNKEVSLRPIRWYGTSILLGEWLLFFFAFLLLIPGDFSFFEKIFLGAWYGGASILSLFAFVVPAGIAIREAIFVAAPGIQGFEVTSLLLIASIARLAFLSAEICATCLVSIGSGKK